MSVLTSFEQQQQQQHDTVNGSPVHPITLPASTPPPKFRMLKASPIPFPAPAPIPSPSPSRPSTSTSTSTAINDGVATSNGRSRRVAAQNAASAITKSAAAASARAARDEEGGMTASDDESGGSSLTNDEDGDSTAASWTMGEDGETDEHLPYNDDNESASMGEPTTDEENPVKSKKPTPKKRKTPVKRKRTAAPAATAAEANGVASTDYAAAGAEGQQDGEEGEADTEATPAKKNVRTKGSTSKKPKGKGKKAAKQDGDESDLTTVEDLEDDAPKPKKARKTRKPREPKPEPVYIIPDVERLPNPGYHGRLGYACLNTILRNLKKPKDPVFCSRTCRIDSIKKNGMDFLKELGKQNCRDLLQLIQWNEDNNIRFMRLSSEMFPFASHGVYGYDLSYAQEELQAAGDLARKYGHRLTTHPGQFTQLGSPRKEVVHNAVKDLQYHCEMLDRMGLDQDSVMIIHGGGVFGDKAATIERLKENYKTKLPDKVKARLVLENDEICYNVDDLLPICEELSIPLVLDYHHHSIFPTAEHSLEELMPRILSTWEKKGIKPKFHLSEPRPGAVTVMERRAHSDRCKLLPIPLPAHVDLMIEAKDKEQAVLQLYRIYDLQPVKHESLRPPAEVETLRTGGRKSNKKKKASSKEEDESEEGVEDPEAAAAAAAMEDAAMAGKGPETEVMKAELEEEEHNHPHIVNADGDVLCKPTVSPDKKDLLDLPQVGEEEGSKKPSTPRTRGRPKKATNATSSRK